MVARHDHPRDVWKFQEEFPCCSKLVRFGALCQVAANNNHVWFELRRNSQQRFPHPLDIGRTKVQIGNVQDSDQREIVLLGT